MTRSRRGWRRRRRVRITLSSSSLKSNLSPSRSSWTRRAFKEGKASATRPHVAVIKYHRSISDEEPAAAFTTCNTIISMKVKRNVKLQSKCPTFVTVLLHVTVLKRNSLWEKYEKKLDIQTKPATDYLVIIKYENERIYFKFTFTLKQFSKLNQLN